MFLLNRFHGDGVARVILEISGDAVSSAVAVSNSEVRIGLMFGEAIVVEKAEVAETSESCVAGFPSFGLVNGRSVSDMTRSVKEMHV